mmetsp:Transcript_49476/g.105175  ORF Transcript_49476/g.105175 Transcript_49476/m.105175 type:complete len:189 (+) Transcript_49476:61-627(+)|eukprot:CAMPEP_0172534088 /NCGR_PEP_ID=MMETSP1067-20121228/6578_1 /TAXON_ID=265564 ORGANISM="Thalassiosira punctigera, Strain Tpunct2005C2" /NCGR_SAMPLE_ID=MMETSP1067 /ASSEMBLY_ACC=CAM_ASM_000444 /LENGTH=188 /DNA_ID=CAMNT_0013318827 /DNA_START=57 /DNA_END=623 /DNA_ORIENTATION=-
MKAVLKLVFLAILGTSGAYAQQLRGSVGTEENTHIDVGGDFWSGESSESLPSDFSFDGMGKEDEAYLTDTMDEEESKAKRGKVFIAGYKKNTRANVLQKNIRKIKGVQRVNMLTSSSLAIVTFKKKITLARAKTLLKKLPRITFVEMDQEVCVNCDLEEEEEEEEEEEKDVLTDEEEEGEFSEDVAEE